MEFVDGPSLADALADGPIEPSRALDIVAQASAALEAARQAGVAHCAVTPENILLSRDGLVKLTRFDTSHAAPTWVHATGVEKF
jgi:serine/threonine protein kinase